MTPSEEFISYVWKYQKFRDVLVSATGQSITVLKPGMLNTNAGPDFLHAKLQVDETEWNGSVELHVKSSDWNKHGHSADSKYNNVVLHVVWQHDAEIPALAKVPTLEIASLVSPTVLEQYQLLQAPYQNIPCEQFVSDVDCFLKSSWLNRMLVARLEEKVHAIQDDYMVLQSNLNESFYRLMAKAFGQKINQHGFDMLTRALPLKILLKHADKVPDLEALLFGVGGMLEEPQDAYQRDLAQRFTHFKHKYGLVEIPSGSWNFLRLRPANFPTVRLAQFAALIHKAGDFLALPTQSPDFKSLQALLHVKASEYWDSHYTFGKTSTEKPKWISKGFYQHLIINVFVPFGFYYKRRTGGASLEWVEDLLGEVAPENNAITRKMEAAGFENNSSLTSQALYHLNKNYCAKSKCLSCAVGNAVLSRKTV